MNFTIVSLLVAFKIKKLLAAPGLDVTSPRAL